MLKLVVFRRCALVLLCAVVSLPATARDTHASFGVATANPLASQAGLRILESGGSAIDAAVAIQAVLGLVEPQSSGLGGGAFMMYYDAKQHRTTAYDGRETAPTGAGPDWFIEHGQPLTFGEAVLSGHSTGVPGAVAMLGLAQSTYGKLPWRKLFDDASRLARDGFAVSPRLATFISLKGFPEAGAPDVRRYFSKPDGTPYRAGDTLRNPAYAETLQKLAWGGARALYHGPLANAIVARLAQSPRPSTMTRVDLSNYRAHANEALCAPFHQLRVCVPQPPSSGVSLLQALALLDHTDMAQRGPKDARAWVLLAEAERLMYADRDQYVADPAFVDVPVAGLLDPAYVAARAQLIGEHPAVSVEPGVPPAAPARARDRTREAAGTSHFVVVDRAGNVVSMTTTVESLFGSGRMVGGFFLNNQLTDFSFSPTTEDGKPVANAVAAGKRPRSSMSPILVFDAKGQFVAALGSPGGSAILAYNLKSLVAIFDWGLSMQDAFNLPNLIARGDSVIGGLDRFDPTLLQAMEAQGLTVQAPRGENSGLQGLMRLPDGRLVGGADTRREGAVFIR